MALMSSDATRMMFWKPSMTGWKGLLWRLEMIVSPVGMFETTGWRFIDNCVIWLMLSTICWAVKARASSVGAAAAELAAATSKAVEAILKRMVIVGERRKDELLVRAGVESSDVKAVIPTSKMVDEW